MVEFTVILEKLRSNALVLLLHRILSHEQQLSLCFQEAGTVYLFSNVDRMWMRAILSSTMQPHIV
jgi:hypothetical protein